MFIDDAHMERAGEGNTTSLDSCANHALLRLTGKFSFYQSKHSFKFDSNTFLCKIMICCTQLMLLGCIGEITQNACLAYMKTHTLVDEFHKEIG